MRYKAQTIADSILNFSLLFGLIIGLLTVSAGAQIIIIKDPIIDNIIAKFWDIDKIFIKYGIPKKNMGDIIQHW